MAATPAGPHAARRHIAVIPCRWGSSRFPGKPLALLGGMPLLWHVHQRCTEAQRIDEVVVATDDDRIESACRQLRIPCVMTGDHRTGTDRVAECAQRIEADAYVNVQGDEPFIPPPAIDAVSERLESGTTVVNAYAALNDAASVVDHNVVKVVTGEAGNALMFSRQPIPYPRSGRPEYSRQLGLYGFTRGSLDLFRQLRRGPLERAEDIEMMRFIEHGHTVQMIPVDYHGTAVDTPEDLTWAQSILAGSDLGCNPPTL